MFQKRVMLKGAFLLAAAGILGKIIGFFYRIFLSRAIGADGMGIYQLIFPLYALASSICASGIQVSISRFVAAKTASGDTGGARKIFHIGLLLSLGLSLAVSCLLFTFHGALAANFIKEPETSSLLQLLSLAIPFGTLHSCINGYYFGLKRADIPASSEILEYVARLAGVMVICHILTGQGSSVTPSVAVYGIIIEEFFAALFSVTALTLYFAARPALPKPRYSASHYVKELLSLSVPITLNRMLVTLLTSIEALLIPLQLRLFGLSSSDALALYGVLTGMALPLILFPTSFTAPLCTMLLPVISEEQAAGRMASIASAIRKICLACLALGIFCFAVFFCLGGLAGRFLFQDALAGAFIRALAFLCPLLYLNPALSAILNGLGKTSQVFFHSLLGILIRIAFMIFAIPRLGINGFFYGMFAGQAAVCALSARAITKSFVNGR